MHRTPPLCGGLGFRKCVCYFNRDGGSSHELEAFHIRLFGSYEVFGDGGDELNAEASLGKAKQGIQSGEAIQE